MSDRMPQKNRERVPLSMRQNSLPAFSPAHPPSDRKRPILAARRAHCGTNGGPQEPGMILDRGTGDRKVPRRQVLGHSLSLIA